MIVDKKVRRILVADIGGTNARFAIAKLSSGRQDSHSVPKIECYSAFPCADFHDAYQLIAHYLQSYGCEELDAACFAVAGPVHDNSAYLTNLGWRVEGKQVAEKFNLPLVTLANDFEALARSVTALNREKLMPLHLANPLTPHGPICVMGPGTGFGLAQVIRSGSSVLVVPTEGGHSSFVPHGILERKVWDAVLTSMGRITVETLMSGIGILRIYRAICALHDVTPLNYEPGTISQRAVEEGDEICRKTLDVFCNMLGGIAADVALTLGATGGVFLGGGILPKIADFVQKSGLVDHFLDKPPMEDFVAKIPVSLIMDPEAALIGASLLANDRL